MPCEKECLGFVLAIVAVRNCDEFVSLWYGKRGE